MFDVRGLAMDDCALNCCPLPECILFGGILFAKLFGGILDDILFGRLFIGGVAE